MAIEQLPMILTYFNQGLITHTTQHTMTTSQLKVQTQNLSDEEIVDCIRNKDIRGINALYNQYSGYMLGMTQEIVKVEYFSEIALQNAFLKVWKKIDSYSFEKGRFFTWVLNIVRNSAIDMIRSKNYKQSIKLISLDNVIQKPTPVSLLAQVEYLDIKDIVCKLDVKYKELIELVYFKGYTHKEVSEKLDIPLGTVKSRIRKAFQDLRDILSE